MKRILFTMLVLFIALSSAVAEDIDLSSLSFDDLSVLRARCQVEMMARDEWQEVEVPQGVYIVGKDIPEGKWTLYCRTGYMSVVSFGDTLDAAGQMVIWSLGGRQANENVYNLNYKNYREGSRTEWTVDLINGDYFVVAADPITFTPGDAVKTFKFK